jgi:uncharacterized membrane protein YvbJ
MFCQKCGAVDNGGVSCSVCGGKDFGSEKPELTEEQREIYAAGNVTSAKPSSSSSSDAGCSVAIFVVLLLVGIIWYFIS